MRGINHILWGWYECDWRWKNFECWNQRKRRAWHVIVCASDNKRSNPRKSQILTLKWKMWYSRHHKCCNQCRIGLYDPMQSFRTIDWREHNESGVSKFWRILPYLWPKTQVSEIEGFGWWKKRERSRVWRGMGVRGSNKMCFQCLCVLYIDYRT